MSTNSFASQLEGYSNWRDRLATAISDYQAWVEQQDQADGEQDLRVYELIESLKSDKLVIALVAEFSRGKTELLNAIFFADHNERLLPSAAGRTTMCPTEIRYDEKEGPCIKLLPIETRKTSLSISEYKSTPVHWTTVHILKLKSAPEIHEIFSEITKTKLVNKREAQELGLYNPDSENCDAEFTENGMIEVPVWRHAIINYPHPLLKQGLVILDTPGLNALGSEPELTLKMLPSAHAILFLLAADIGTTRSDLEVWKNHVSTVNNSRNNGIFVVLNKIDALWDKLQDETEINKIISRQVDETANILKIDKKFIFPVSAQKGLIGKIKNDVNLREKSGLDFLEARLANDIVPSKHELIRNRIIYEISGRIESNLAILENKLTAINNQLSHLKELGGKNLDAIDIMVNKMRSEKQKYDKELMGFQVTRKILSQHAKDLLDHLSAQSFKKLIRKTRKDMHESWTTLGLKNGMRTLFDGIVARMDEVNKQSELITSKVDDIYLKLHTEFGLAKLEPASLMIASYYVELKKLEAKAEAFRNSPITTMTEQHFVIKKFFITLVSQAHEIFNGCNDTVRNWFQTVVNTVFIQIQAHKKRIDKNLEDIKKIHNNLDNLGEQINILEYERKSIEEQKNTLNKLLARLQEPITTD